MRDASLLSGLAFLRSEIQFEFLYKPSRFFETICGIQPKYDGGKEHFRLAPIPGKRLKYASASYHSLYGEITSGWKWLEDGTFVWNFTIPANTTAEIVPPPGFTPADEQSNIRQAVPGSYELRFRA